MADKKSGYAVFERNDDPAPIAINPTHVQDVIDDSGGQCEVVYAGGASYFVKGTLEHVLGKLNTALEAHCVPGPRGERGAMGATGMPGPPGVGGVTQAEVDARINALRPQHGGK